MADDHKRTEALKLWLTEQELLDLTRMAIKDDRKPGEMGRVILRRFIYGYIGAAADEIHGANRAEQGRSE